MTSKPTIHDSQDEQVGNLASQESNLSSLGVKSWRVWFVLSAAVLGVSSAGAIFQHVDQIPPLMRASWRLQLTTLMLIPFAISQYRKLTIEQRQLIFARDSVLLQIASGIFLAAHFGTWVISLDHTSLTHSLLFVTAHPLILLMMTVFAIRFGLFKSQKLRQPNRYEWLGASAGLVGVVITLQDIGGVQGTHQVSVFGDLMAFLGGVFVVGYLVIGRRLRKFTPLFIYATIVTGVAAILLAISSLITEPSTPTFGWVAGEWLFWFALLAFCAGIIGHTGLNYSLKHLPPLVISVSVTLEPVIGSVIGFLLFSSGIPGFWTSIGGVVLLAGLMLVAYGSSSQPTTADGTEGKSENQS